MRELRLKMCLVREEIFSYMLSFLPYYRTGSKLIYHYFVDMFGQCNYFLSLMLNFAFIIWFCVKIAVSLHKNSNSMRSTIFITLEPYLAQWLIHENEGAYPIPIKRASAEADILQYYLQKQPRDADYHRQIKALPGQVEILIPAFRLVETRTHNYLPPRGEMALHQCIRNRFKVALWKDLHTVGNVVQRTDVVISAWMERHGIEVDDKNWNTIAKILQRSRAVYCKNHRLTNHKSSKHKKK